MGRPPSPTGEIMDRHITGLLMALTRLGCAARRPLIDRVIDPVEWVRATGQVLHELEAAEYEAREIERIVEANRRRGVRREDELPEM